MKNNIDRLLQKREQLEKQIKEAQLLEKRKAHVHQIVFSEFDKYDTLLHVDEQLLCASLATAFADIANKCSSV